MKYQTQHKDILFLVSLAPEVVQDMLRNGYDLASHIFQLKKISNVELRESITPEDIAEALHYKVVIILAHNDPNANELILADGKRFPIKDLVESLNPNFSGLLDLAFCESFGAKSAIKTRCPQCLVQSIKTPTHGELRLYLYPDLLKDFSFSPEEDYRERYHEAYRRAIQKSITDQQKHIKDVKSLPEGTKLGTDTSENLKTSVFTPHIVPYDELYDIKVVLHYDEDNGTLEAKIKDLDKMMAQREHNVVLQNIQIGDELLLNLSFLDAKKRPTELIIVDGDNPYHVIIDSKTKTVKFEYSVTKDYSSEYFRIVLEYIKDGRCLRKSDEIKVYVKTEDNHPIPKTGCRKGINVNPKSGLAPQPPRQQLRQRPRETMTFKWGKNYPFQMTVYLFNALINNDKNHKKWIEGDQKAFIDLFSGDYEPECKLTWLEPYGKGSLVWLFKVLIQKEIIKVPKNFTLSSILEGHFIDRNGQWLKGLDKGNKPNNKAIKAIETWLKKIRISKNSEEEDEAPQGLGREDWNGMHWGK